PSVPTTTTPCLTSLAPVSFIAPPRVVGVSLRVAPKPGTGSKCLALRDSCPGPRVSYVAVVSAAFLIEAASVSTYRLVSDRVISQPIPDSGPDTVRARVSRLPAGCGSTTCAAVMVTPGELDTQVYDDPSASSVTVHTAVGSRGCCNRV